MHCQRAGDRGHQLNFAPFAVVWDHKSTTQSASAANTRRTVKPARRSNKMAAATSSTVIRSDTQRRMIVLLLVAVSLLQLTHVAEARSTAQQLGTRIVRPTDNCNRHRLRRATHEDQLESIKSEILSKLGLSRPPKMNATNRGHLEQHRYKSVDDRAKALLQPDQEMYVDGPSKSRVKRSIHDDVCNSTTASRAEGQCCRFPLEVDFNLLGWHWIIAPRKYTAYVCSGTCPNKNLTTSSSCCSPKRVSALSLLYYGEQMNVEYGRLPGMIVEECHCS